jgi:formylglycine-generating enzyme required for sulfatase activity
MKKTSILLAVVAALALGCTSFAFKKTGKGAAPDDLKDRSRMVKIPGGTFEMGAPSSEPDEYPPHKVALDGFLIDKTEVTIEEYNRCVEARSCRAPNVVDDSENVTPQNPVVGVSWYDATKYCEWLGKRLPTEAEWEYAARAPRFQVFPWEGKLDPAKVNLRGNADGYERTAPVGSFPKGQTGLGLLDMGGNAAEWVADWYDATYYGKVSGLIAPGATTMPTGETKGGDEKPATTLRTATNPKGPEASTGTKVVRGGAWSDADYLARTTARVSLDPNLSNDAVGFRCAADR